MPPPAILSHPFASTPAAAPSASSLSGLAAAIKGDQRAQLAQTADSAAASPAPGPEAAAAAPGLQPPGKNCSSVLGLVLASPRDFSLFGDMILVSSMLIVQLLTSLNGRAMLLWLKGCHGRV